MLLTLLLRLTIALSNSFWNMKHEMRSAKLGISASSNRNLKVHQIFDLLLGFNLFVLLLRFVQWNFWLAFNVISNQL